MSFGDFVHNLRVENKKTLREFCLEKGLDPTSWSKVERNVNPPPRDKATLEKWSQYFDLKPMTKEWKRFMDWARISRASGFADRLHGEKIVSLLPAFNHCNVDIEIGEREVRLLARKIRNANTPDKFLAGG
jgi:transcriptional regulator with XRE-family HTH domain